MISYKKQGVIKNILIHHTVGFLSLSECRRYHQSLGWVDIGYHKYIIPTGVVLQGRPDWAVGSHCPGFNSKSIGIALVGNFAKAPPTNPQVNSLIQTLAILCNRHNLNTDSIITHTMALSGSTSCPGHYLIKLMPFILKSVKRYL